MAVKKSYKAMIKRLKKQVRMLQKKEEKAKNKLKTALKKMRTLSRSYKSKLTKKIRQMKGKMADVQATTYAKAAVHFERQLLKGIDAKSRALESALTKIEKKHVAKLKKSLAKKGKARKAAPAKKARRSVKRRRGRT